MYTIYSPLITLTSAFGYRQIDYNSNTSLSDLVVPSHIDIIYQPASKEEHIIQSHKSLGLIHLEYDRQLPKSRRP
jgi:hypothetical protein